MPRAAMLAAAAMLTAASPGWAATWGLVVGVDDYVYQRPLTGAANDARDIAQALQARGVEPMVLLNQAADREAIEAAWKATLAKASPGDTIIFTYAGHGAQEPDADGDERANAPGDDRDEAFLLANFNPKSAAGANERIVDDELNQWFAAAAEKNVRVTFLADSCHSGTMTRQATSTRFAGAYEPPAEAVRDVGPPVDLDNVFFVAAVDDDKATPEVNIGGVMRGAASYSFARALEGAADGDGDGVVTRDELDDYMARAAATFSDQALPRVTPLSGGATPVFGGAARPKPRRGEVRLTLASSTGALLGATGAEVERRYGAASLNWDQAEKTVANSEGDVVAYDVSGKIALRRVVDKFRLIETARQAAAAAPVAVSLSGGAKLWRAGERTEIVIGPRGAPYLTVMVLGNMGETSLVFPYNAAEAGPLNPDAAIRFPIEITPEGAGAEHVVVLATEAPPAALREALKRGGPARDFADLMAELVEGRAIEAGVGRVFTAVE